MSNSPLVSVITPVYNSARFLSEAVASVAAQTFKDWEMVIVDDGSTDGSVRHARDLAGRERRIRFSALGANCGAAVARNTAIENARGRYIAFLDSDDQWLPAKLEKQLDFMERNRYALTHTYYERITETGDRTGVIVKPPYELSYRDMLKSNQMGCLSVVYDSREFGKTYMPLIRARQDYGLWLKLLKQGVSAYCLPESLALYRARSGSASSNKLEMLKYNWFLYRNVEELSPWGSAYYVAWNIARKFIN